MNEGLNNLTGEIVRARFAFRDLLMDENAKPEDVEKAEMEFRRLFGTNESKEATDIAVGNIREDVKRDSGNDLV